MTSSLPEIVGIEGADAPYVKLLSSDGHEFIIKRENALTSGTIKAMLSSPGGYAENETNEVLLREVPSHVLQRICHYFLYKEFQVMPEISLELLMAAHFLDC